MVVSTLASLPRVPVEKAGTACHASGQLLVLDPVGQAPGMTPVLLDRRRQFIGHDVECTIQLPESGLPSRHAVILRGQRQLVIKAFDARTWLNDRAVTESSLCEGDRLKVGSFEFRVRGATAYDLLQNVPSPGQSAGVPREPEADSRLALRRMRLSTMRSRLKERREQLHRDLERLVFEQARLERRGARLSTFRFRLKERGEQIRRGQQSLDAERASSPMPNAHKS